MDAHPGGGFEMKKNDLNCVRKRKHNLLLLVSVLDHEPWEIYILRDIINFFNIAASFSVRFLEIL
jgi:hypothetical protein